MRLRTLPVSVAGVITAYGFAWSTHTFRLLPGVLCLVFAILAQIASNFANEYYDFRDGLDRVGRDGPRRGVTEGDITPQAMKRATFVTLGVACAIGCSLIAWGGWWLLPAGIVIALGAIAYSTGPYPLSRHGWGEMAVIFFFGIIPVNLTYYIMSRHFSSDVFWGSLAMGLMGANVLIVNNYRDIDDDRAVGKHTLAVKIGPRLTSLMYLFNGFAAIAAIAPSLVHTKIIAYIYLAIHLVLWKIIDRHHGSALNPLLGMTAMLMLAFALAFSITEAWYAR